MQDLVLTPEHELKIENLDLVLFDTLESLTAQKVKINLLNYLGEWFRDINTGVPYLQTILGRRGTKRATDAVIKTTILNTDNIDNIIEYESFIDNDRKLIITFSANMVSGGTLSNVTVEV